MRVFEENYLSKEIGIKDMDVPNSIIIDIDE